MKARQIQVINGAVQDMTGVKLEIDYSKYKIICLNAGLLVAWKLALSPGDGKKKPDQWNFADAKGNNVLAFRLTPIEAIKTAQTLYRDAVILLIEP